MKRGVVYSAAKIWDLRSGIYIPKLRNYTVRQGISSLLKSINGRGYCLTDKINPKQLLILIKFNPHQPSVIFLHSYSQSNHLLEFYDLLEMLTLREIFGLDT